MFAEIMEKMKGFVLWVFGMVKNFFFGLLGYPKKALCWLHSKFCGC
jgi:hypothetical protein